MRGHKSLASSTPPVFAKTGDVPNSVAGLSWWTGIIMQPNVALGQGAVWQ